MLDLLISTAETLQAGERPTKNAPRPDKGEGRSCARSRYHLVTPPPHGRQPQRVPTHPDSV